MSSNNIKKTPLVLAMSIATLFGVAQASRVYAVQLNLQSPVDSTAGSDFAVPYDSTLQESGLVESAAQESEVAGFTCDLAPEGAETEVQPDTEILSHLGSNLVAQAGTFDIGQFAIPAEKGPIIGEMCEIEGAPVGGAGSRFPFAALAPLGLLPLLATGGGNNNAPEPFAIPFVFASLGLGGVIARKRFQNKEDKE